MDYSSDPTCVQEDILSEDQYNVTEVFERAKTDEKCPDLVNEEVLATEDFSQSFEVPMADVSKNGYDLFRVNGLLRCKQCSYQTDHPSHFKRHMDRHAGVKYGCEKCDYTSTQKHKLKNHEQAKHVE